MVVHIIKRTILYTILFFGYSSRAATLDYQSVAETAQECGHLNWTNSIITFLVDPTGTLFVVKQLKCNDRADRWAKIICEVVALELGHSINVRLNKVSIIPAGVEYIGKELAVPATLHTHAPGIRFDKYKGDAFPNLSIKQRGDGGVRIGLTRDVIEHMSRHKDFPAMVALDTFVGNPARHKHNFFYDVATDSFYGIDMGASFHADLCMLSLNTIEALTRDKKSRFSSDEEKALRVYCTTLKKLVNLHKPSALCAMIDTYAERAGLFDRTYFTKETQKSCAAYLADCKKTIYKSYGYAIELIHALEMLFEEKKF